MSRNVLLVLALLGGLQAGCGSDAGGGDDEIQGLAVAGSGFAGMAIAATSVDASVPTSRLYLYDFASGVVKETLGGESGNPALFTVDGKVLLFNRQPDNESFRVIDPKADASGASAARSLSLADGDPFDVASLVAGQSVLLASPLGGKLQTLDYNTGAVTDVEAVGLDSVALRPVSAYRSGAKMYVLHSGLALDGGGSGTGDGTQQIYVLSIKPDGSVTFDDLDAVTGKVQGLKLTATHPSGFLNKSASSPAATIVGLCGATMTACQAGADRLTGTSVAKLATYDASFKPRFLNQIVDGPDANTVYAHVKSDAKHVVVRLDVATKTVTEVHSFPDERLYGIAYDQGSRTLFVGGVNGLKGTLTLYKDDIAAGAFELDGVPYRTTFF